jgi:hypothetical protein
MTMPSTAGDRVVADNVWRVILANFVWVNSSEVFRYFIFVRPMMQEALRPLPDVAPMNIPVFLIWGIWDLLVILSVTGFVWLFLERFGPTFRNALIAGSLMWVTIFVILWLGLYNMNLAPASVPMIALPLAWIEMIVAALIVRWGMQKSALAM